MNIKLPITAMVVGRNEAHFLDKCFRSVSFCKEILYTDILSADNSKSIAKNFNATIFDSELIPSCEFAQALMVQEAKYKWILFIDPDEYLDKDLAIQLIELYPKLLDLSQIGAVRVPWQFYLKKIKLKGTVWGNNKKFILVHKDRFTFNPIIHYGRTLNKGYQAYDIDLNTEATNVLHHNWMPNFNTFLFKHIRYLKREGRDRFKLGKRISFTELIKTPFKEFKASYFSKKGYQDGFTGLFLSVFWAFYQTFASIDLYLFCKGLKRID
jgi:hypothetical protein